MKLRKRQELKSKIKELQSDFAGYENFERERKLEKIVRDVEEENGALRETLRKIKWEFSQCYGMDNPESFQNRRIKTHIYEIERYLEESNE